MKNIKKTNSESKSKKRKAETLLGILSNVEIFAKTVDEKKLEYIRKWFGRHL